MIFNSTNAFHIQILAGYTKIFLFVALGTLTACTETIDLELKTASRRLVVEGTISSHQSIQYIRLTQSVPFLSDSASPPVSNAVVMLSDGQRSDSLREVAELPGFYITSSGFKGIPNRTYHLKISGVDINNDGEDEHYEASSYMPLLKDAPDSIHVEYNENWELWQIMLYARDNPDSEDYYLFRTYKNGTLLSNNISEFSVSDDKFFENNQVENAWVQSIDASEKSEKINEGDIISLEMSRITKEYYQFIESVQQEKRGQYPLFSGPPANVPGNISNGALGFFTAFSSGFAHYPFGEGS